MTREEVLAVIKNASIGGWAVNKADILNELGLDDTKYYKNAIDKILTGLKEEGIIATYQIYDEDEGTFGGRGYALT